MCLFSFLFFFFFNDTATTEIYTLSLHDALPIWADRHARDAEVRRLLLQAPRVGDHEIRSEEHTSELQSQSNLVCRLLLEKKKKPNQQRELEEQKTEIEHIIASSTPDPPDTTLIN